jgi:hypothetical protein
MGDRSTVFATALVGAAVGAVAGGLFGLARRKFPQWTGASEPDLGYAWPHVLTDHNLATTMARLRTFRHAGEHHYRAIGDACDDLISLWSLARDTSLPAQPIWQVKSHRYVTRVVDSLMALSEGVTDARRRVDAQRHMAGAPAERPARARPAAGRGRGRDDNNNVNIQEYNSCAETVHQIAKDYHKCIGHALTVRTCSNPHAAPLLISPCGGDDDDYPVTDDDTDDDDDGDDDDDDDDGEYDA